MKRRTLKVTKAAKKRPYAAKIKLKSGGRARDPRWMWWLENVRQEVAK
jgi:hypothetical protein